MNSALSGGRSHASARRRAAAVPRALEVSPAAPVKPRLASSRFAPARLALALLGGSAACALAAIVLGTEFQSAGGPAAGARLTAAAFRGQAGALDAWLLRDQIEQAILLGLTLTAGGLFLAALMAWTRRGAALLALAAIGAAQAACTPYKQPRFEEIAPNETGFLIPLDEDPQAGQLRFESEQYLETRKVATKRQPIEQRWVKTGYGWLSGHWMPTQRLIKVSRSPMVREWTKSTGSGTAAKDEAVHVESRDSVNLSVGFTVSMMIPENLTARFLYFYPNGSLAQVMDTEARSRVQQSVAEVCAKYDADTLRFQKREISAAALDDLREFYAARGVQVTTLAMVGGLAYENPALQKAIDEAAIAQQQKMVNEARVAAQKSENDRKLLEAEAARALALKEADNRSAIALKEVESRAAVAAKEAESRNAIALRDAEAQAAVARKQGEARAESLRLLAAALASSGASSLLDWQRLEVQRELAQRWGGTYPGTFIAGGNGMSSGLNGGPLVLLQPPPTPAK